jgi:hypothetical protein
MAIRTVSVLVTAGVSAGLFVALSACDGYRLTCHTASGAFAAKYILSEQPSGECTDALTAELSALKGDIVGVQWYASSHFNRDPESDKNLVAIRTNALGTTAVTYGSRKTADGAPAADKSRPINAVGTFTTARPDETDFCRVESFSPAEQVLPATIAVPPNPSKEGDKGQPALPELAAKYEWSNMSVFVDPVVAGSQFSADLRYTKNGCTASYKVVAVYPLVTCLDKEKKPDDRFCDVNPQPALGKSNGSGLNFPVFCDPDLGFCVLKGDTIP